ncbi:HAMP domain-containing histidine kinase [Mycoplasmatota bacterium]|nr:HAMP domain-containing histidine kinase [Mycoplasmatota bacterium]
MVSFSETTKRKNITILSILLTVVFIVINISLYIINHNFITNKIKEENSAFLVLSTHLINENETSVVIEFMKHYSHTHAVEVEFYNEDMVMLFSSDINNQFLNKYSISSDKGIYYIFIDNTDSVTVNLADRNFLYVNLSLFIIYIFAIFLFIKNSNKSSEDINHDIKKVMTLIDNESPRKISFHYSEFKEIYNDISIYLQKIDLLKEQKEINIKGLAHDIKTPLTIVLNYLENVEDIKSYEKNHQTVLEAINDISNLINDLIDENYNRSFREINLAYILEEIIQRYDSIFASKGIKINYKNEVDLLVNWSKRDFTRVIENILSNAYYYSYPNTILEINTYKDENIHIEFINEGNHISSSNLIKIFDKGFRNKRTSASNRNGKGLGLYISRLILNSISGDIKAESIGNKNKFEIII